MSADREAAFSLTNQGNNPKPGTVEVEPSGATYIIGGSHGYWCWWGVSVTLFKATTPKERLTGLIYAFIHVLTYLAVVGLNATMAFDFAAGDPAKDMAAAAFGTTLASLLLVVGISFSHLMSVEKPVANNTNPRIEKNRMVYSPIMLSAIMAGSRASIVFDFMAYNKIGTVAAADKVAAFQLFVIATITLKFYLAAIMTNNLRLLGNNFVP